MQIKSARSISELTEVLKDPNSTGPEIAYWVFSEITKEKWENMTITASGDYNNEFPKTYGHYHNVNVDETYKLISGQGIFMLQKRKFIDDNFANDFIEEILFLEMIPGEEVTITPEWGHSWINIGNEPLVTFDDWRSGHTEADYEPIKNLRGMAYYFVKNGRSADIVENSNYKEVPQPKWVNLTQFKTHDY